MPSYPLSACLKRNSLPIPFRASEEDVIATLPTGLYRQTFTSLKNRMQDIDLLEVSPGASVTDAESRRLSS